MRGYSNESWKVVFPRRKSPVLLHARCTVLQPIEAGMLLLLTYFLSLPCDLLLDTVPIFYPVCI